MSKIKTPGVSWAQRQKTLFLSINVQDIVNPVIKVNDFELSFSGRESLNNDVYQIEMLFLKKVDPQKTQFHVRPRCVEIVIEKAEKGCYWERLLADKSKQHWLKVDFKRWKDEDDSSSNEESFSDEEQMKNLSEPDAMGKSFSEIELTEKRNNSSSKGDEESDSNEGLYDEDDLSEFQTSELLSKRIESMSSNLDFLNSEYIQTVTMLFNIRWPEYEYEDIYDDETIDYGKILRYLTNHYIDFLQKQRNRIKVHPDFDKIDGLIERLQILIEARKCLGGLHGECSRAPLRPCLNGCCMGCCIGNCPPHEEGIPYLSFLTHEPDSEGYEEAVLARKKFISNYNKQTRTKTKKLNNADLQNRDEQTFAEKKSSSITSFEANLRGMFLKGKSKSGSKSSLTVQSARHEKRDDGKCGGDGCLNKSAKDCKTGRCGRCCPGGCPRHQDVKTSNENILGAASKVTSMEFELQESFKAKALGVSYNPGDNLSFPKTEYSQKVVDFTRKYFHGFNGNFLLRFLASAHFYYLNFDNRVDCLKSFTRHKDEKCSKQLRFLLNSHLKEAKKVRGGLGLIDMNSGANSPFSALKNSAPNEDSCQLVGNGKCVGGCSKVPAEYCFNGCCAPCCPGNCLRHEDLDFDAEELDFDSDDLDDRCLACTIMDKDYCYCSSSTESEPEEEDDTDLNFLQQILTQRKGEKPKESRECRGGCGKLSAYSCTSGCCAGCCPGHCSRHSGPPNPVPVAPPTSQSVTYSATAARMMAAMGYQAGAGLGKAEQGRMEPVLRMPGQQQTGFCKRGLGMPESVKRGGAPKKS